MLTGLFFFFFFLSAADILTCHCRESTGVTTDINAGCVPFSFPGSLSGRPPCTTPNPGTGLPKWNAAIIEVIDYSCAFAALTGRNVCPEKAPFSVGLSLRGTLFEVQGTFIVILQHRVAQGDESYSPILLLT